ncbi:hypothetical protein [Leclercia sp. Marseille-Q4284]|uniref:hypothetical protein n=1 Tax=Leclercia sp. Marseille-Q4284 TaxID=2866582 RepID=UPI001CE3D666|nr:hypothetical protein [Leclercia sp. Marseille-Q4284]
MCEKCRQREANADFKLQLRITVETCDYGAKMIGNAINGEIGGAIDILLTKKGTGVDAAFRSCGLATVDDLPPGYGLITAAALRHMADALEEIEEKPELYNQVLMHPDGMPVTMN